MYISVADVLRQSFCDEFADKTGMSKQLRDSFGQSATCHATKQNLYPKSPAPRAWFGANLTGRFFHGFTNPLEEAL